MFEQLTQDEREKATLDIDGGLTKARNLIVEAIVEFFAALTADPTTSGYQQAFATLRAKIVNDRRRREDEDPAPSLANGHGILNRIWRHVEERRRPDGLRNHHQPDVTGDWGLVEYVLDHVGEPLTLATLNEVTESARPGGVWTRKVSGAGAMALVVAIANENRGKLAPARTKVEGKVAYLVRESDEEVPEHGWSEYRIPELAEVRS